MSDNPFPIDDQIKYFYEMLKNTPVASANVTQLLLDALAGSLADIDAVPPQPISAHQVLSHLKARLDYATLHIAPLVDQGEVQDMYTRFVAAVEIYRQKLRP